MFNHAPDPHRVHALSAQQKEVMEAEIAMDGILAENVSVLHAMPNNPETGETGLSTWRLERRGGRKRRSNRAKIRAPPSGLIQCSGWESWTGKAARKG